MGTAGREGDGRGWWRAGKEGEGGKGRGRRREKRGGEGKTEDSGGEERVMGE